MTRKYPIIPEYLDKAIADPSIDLMDVLHGYLKVEMVELQDIEAQDRYIQGYAYALGNVYGLVYSLMFARMDVLNAK
jgi:hypothetical protein